MRGRARYRVTPFWHSRSMVGNEDTLGVRENDIHKEAIATRSKVIALWVLTVGIVTPTVPLFAHHGTGVAYDTENVVTLTGTVTEWIWANPHCGLLFDVKDDSGNVVHWGAELTNPDRKSVV